MDQRFNREADVWHSLSHKNIMPFLGMCYGIGRYPAAVSPLYNNGDGHQYLADKPQNRLTVVSLATFGNDAVDQ